MNYVDAAAERVKRELAPDLRPGERGEELYRLYGLLVLVKGQECTLEDVHDAWSTWMTIEQPDHDALVPFDDLSLEAQEKDRPYLSAIKRAAERRTL
jgi:hypothetical protein